MLVVTELLLKRAVTFACRYFPQSAKVVVFVNTKRQCDTVASILADKGLACTILHGGKSQVCHRCHSCITADWAGEVQQCVVKLH